MSWLFYCLTEFSLAYLHNKSTNIFGLILKPKNKIADRIERGIQERYVRVDALLASADSNDPKVTR